MRPGPRATRLGSLAVTTMPQRNPEVGERDTGRIRRALESRGYLLSRTNRLGMLLRVYYVDGNGTEQEVYAMTTREVLQRIEQLPDIRQARAAE